MTLENQIGGDSEEYSQSVEISTEGVREVDPKTGDPIEESEDEKELLELRKQEAVRMLMRDRRDALFLAIQAHPAASTEHILSAATKMCRWLVLGEEAAPEPKKPGRIAGKKYPPKKAAKKAAKKTLKKAGPAKKAGKR